MSQHIVLAGNLAQDPDAGISDAGVSWTRMTVITNDRYRDRNGDWTNGPAVRYRVTVFRALADNAANSLHVGDPVLVAGQLTTREYRDTNGDIRLSRDVIADHLGADLARATVTFSRNSRAIGADEPQPVDA